MGPELRDFWDGELQMFPGVEPGEEHISQPGFGEGKIWGRFPHFSTVDFGSVVFRLAGIERKNKLNLTPVIWKKKKSTSKLLPAGVR